jgi:hypothetical protein
MNVNMENWKNDPDMEKLQHSKKNLSQFPRADPRCKPKHGLTMQFSFLRNDLYIRERIGREEKIQKDTKMKIKTKHAPSGAVTSDSQSLRL